jgi:hypothetical protein
MALLGIETLFRFLVELLSKAQVWLRPILYQGIKQLIKDMVN